MKRELSCVPCRRSKKKVTVHFNAKIDDSASMFHLTRDVSSVSSTLIRLARK